MAAVGLNKAKLNLEGARVLIVNSDRFAVELVAQMLRGFGLDDQTVAETVEEARRLLLSQMYDLIVMELVLSDGSGAELAQWLRHLEGNQMRYAPIILLTGQTQLTNVGKFRDSGAHSVVKKPASPQTLFNHIAWSVQPARPFVEFEGYIGPDRRYKFVGPPDGVGRRGNDLPAEIGEAVEPNMSQDEIDAFMKPTKIAT